ncbi:MAG: transporter substrate-binding domain-containing protein [Rhodospirillales bacterium]|nr:transporter substrate-binding domain-containing protein [Rhodospirillales bacterium]
MKLRIEVLFMVAAVGALAVFPAPASCADTIKVASTSEPPLTTADGTGYFDRVYFELFRRMGLTPIRRKTGAERSMINLNTGIDDVTTPRVKGLSRVYPNIIQVPEKVIDIDFVAFTAGLEFAATDWSSLRPYNVGIITGWKILEINVTETRSLVKVDDARQLFLLLAKGRADTVIYEKWQGLSMARQLGISNIKVLGPPLATRAMYPYVHAGRQNLVADMAATLKTMKADGTFKQILGRTLEPLTAGE